MRTANTSNAVAGFEVGGIVPFNRDLFTDADFLASVVTDRPVEYANVLIDARNETGTSTQVPSYAIAVPEQVAYIPASSEHLPEEVQLNIDIPNQVPSTPTHTVLQEEQLLSDMSLDQMMSFRDPVDSILPDEDTQQGSRTITTTPVNFIARELSPNDNSGSPSILTDSTHRLNIEKIPNPPNVTFADISPLPKASTLRKPSQRSKKSEIITSSSHKRKLEEEEENTKTKNAKSKSAQKKPKKTYRKPKNPPKEKKKTWKCPGCGEIYREPITEDWIQCVDCTAWWHEECTSYTGNGPYKCDLCE
ncbi:hypothetical protein HF086_005909 [Spodoptera exigua]|uniref:Zinc finger PHD-type domain-containing protein n=1 Tax=Spodoptera exigua TaxID=7107 RepID=A0A922S827_SPOEX|nr:hypothetical protein HF086_005909 [Spodoptera exigua]